MMVHVVPVVLTLSLAASALADEPSDAWRYVVSEVESGDALYEVSSRTEDPGDEGGHYAIVSRVDYPGGETVEMRAVFRAGEPPPLVRTERVTKTPDGEIVAEERVRFVSEAFPSHEGPLPEDAYPPDLPLGYVLSRLGLGLRRGEASFHTILMNAATIRMDLWVEGREQVEVPAGTFDAYRVRMRAGVDSLFPNLPGFVQPFVSFFVPKHTLWLTMEEPQRLLRYTGLTGPPGSPEMLIELVEIGPRESVARSADFR